MRLAWIRGLSVEVGQVVGFWIYFEVQLIGFADRLDVGWEKKKRVKIDFKVFGLSN